jgi:3-hydroxyacyl-CoA dehydrogenase/enoyl-CoA hydratase/3-hydroxybutyryl-CoA epimerase
MHCWGDGILRTPRDGDIGAIFGLGFPPFLGGPFRYVDALGAAKVVAKIDSYHQQFGARWTPAPALLEMAKAGKRFYPKR